MVTGAAYERLLLPVRAAGRSRRSPPGEGGGCGAGRRRCLPGPGRAEGAHPLGRDERSSDREHRLDASVIKLAA